MVGGMVEEGGWKDREIEKLRVGRQSVGGMVGQHDVVPQPGKKSNKNRKHGLDRLYYTTEPRQRKGGEKRT